MGLCEGDILHNISGDGDSGTGHILAGLGQANGEMDAVIVRGKGTATAVLGVCPVDASHRSDPFLFLGYVVTRAKIILFPSIY